MPVLILIVCMLVWWAMVFGIRQLLGWLQEVVFPAYCESCKQATEQGVCICDDCHKLIQLTRDPYCSRCSHNLERTNVFSDRCIHCHDIDLVSEFVLTCTQFSPQMRELLLRYKYAHGVYLHPYLARLMGEVRQDERLQDLCSDEWVVTSVPLHFHRHRKRRYNQAEMLAVEVARHLDLEHVELLNRTVDTPHLASLGKKGRAQNIKGAFEIREHAVPRRVLLVDDVFTSGATTNECARVLKRAGATQVTVVCLARA